MQHIPHILVVDDENSIRIPLCKNLEKNGFRVQGAVNAFKARELMRRNHFDLIILDIMMPGEDGLTFCKDILKNNETPIILLTALAGETDRIIGLEMGADDYVSKPFSPRELVARIRSILRRSVSQVPKISSRIFKFDDWIIDFDRAELTDKNGVIETVSSGELALLKVLIENPQQTLSRDDILSRTKGREAFPFERSIDVMISRIRKRIEVDSSNPEIIKTIWGGGYSFNANVTPL